MFARTFARRIAPSFAPSVVARRSLHSTARVLSGGGPPTGMHTYSAENSDTTPWDFTKENYEKVNAILKKYPVNRKASGIIPLLHLAQIQNNGWIPLNAMNKIAQVCESSPMQVYEVATFYSMFNREKVGKFHVQVCVTTPCMIRGSDEIMAALEKWLGCKNGETSADGWFTLGEMECMGCCVNAPMIVVSDFRDSKKFSYDFYEDLTPETAINVLTMLKNGEQPKVGPQIDRKDCMPAGGKTTLLEPTPGPYSRDFDALKKKIAEEAAAAKAAAAAQAAAPKA